MVTRYERIYPPSWADKNDPKCPECGHTMFYVGTAKYFKKETDFNTSVDETALVEHKVYQCSTCRRLFKEIMEG